REQYGNAEVLMSDERLNWYPVMQWSEEQQQLTLGERLFGIENTKRLESSDSSKAASAYVAWSSIVAEQNGLYELKASFGGKLSLLCNGQEVKVTGENGNSEGASSEIGRAHV